MHVPAADHHAADVEVEELGCVLRRGEDVDAKRHPAVASGGDGVIAPLGRDLPVGVEPVGILDEQGDAILSVSCGEGSGFGERGSCRDRRGLVRPEGLVRLEGLVRPELGGGGSGGLRNEGLGLGGSGIGGARPRRVNRRSGENGNCGERIRCSDDGLRAMAARDPQPGCRDQLVGGLEWGSICIDRGGR
jgi:hypothetical protein